MYLDTKIRSFSSCSISYLSDVRFSRNQNAGKLVKRSTENIKIVCTYVTAEDAGSSFPANHGKLFPRAFYARHGTERTSQSSQHQHSTQRCEFPVFRSVDSLIYSIHQTKNWCISPMCSAVQCISSSSKARGDFASNLLSTHCFLTGHSRNPMQRAPIFVFGKSDRGRDWQKSWIRLVKSETNTFIETAAQNLRLG